MPRVSGRAQPDGFADFWKEFSAAAATKDKDKIAALTKYPSEELGQQFDVIWKDNFPRLTPTTELCGCAGHLRVLRALRRRPSPA